MVEIKPPPVEEVGDYESAENMSIYIYEVVTDLINLLLEGLDEFDRVAVSLESSDLRYSVFFHFDAPKNYTPQLFLDRLLAVLNSNENFSLFGTVIIRLYRIRLPHGGGKNRLGQLKRGNYSPEEFAFRKRSLVNVPVETRFPNSCVPRSIMLELARITVRKEREFRSKEDDSRLEKSVEEHFLEGVSSKVKRWIKELDSRAEVLCKAAGVSPVGPHSVDDIEKFQRVLPDTQIFFWGAQWRDQLFYRGPVNSANRICLYLNQHHVSIISKPHALLQRQYYCFDCNVTYNQRHNHLICPNRCRYCGGSPPCERDSDGGVLCRLCNRCLPNLSCVQAHKVKGRLGGMSICERLKNCLRCSAFYVVLSRNFVHECGVLYCRNCNERHGKEEKCYLSPRAIPHKRPTSTFAFFDFECGMTPRPDPVTGEVRLYHSVILAVCRKVSTDDEDHFEDSFFYNISDFVDYILAQEKIVLIAHNRLCNCCGLENLLSVYLFSQNYDSNFILKELIRRSIIPRIILKGTSIILFEIPDREIR